jgi:hypothetical protein
MCTLPHLHKLELELELVKDILSLLSSQVSCLSQLAAMPYGPLCSWTAAKIDRVPFGWSVMLLGCSKG